MTNLNVMTIVLKFVVSYEYLSLEESFQSFYFSHGFSKACQHAMTDEKVCKFKIIKFVYIQIFNQICVNI
jgi:hypothetical protein